MTQPARAASAIDAIADDYYQQQLALSPILATDVGVDERQDEYDDFSPAGLQTLADLDRATLAKLDDVEPVDAIDRVTEHAMRERLGLQLERFEARIAHQEINNLACPIQMIRMVYDLMPTETDEQWATIARRLHAVPQALAGYLASLDLAAGEGRRAARRQVQVGIDECEQFTADDGFFATFLADASPTDESVQTRLRGGVEVAVAAYAELGTELRERFLPAAPVEDAVGIDNYRLASRLFLGTDVDLEETYSWGLAEVAAIQAEMEQTADQIKSGASVAEAIEALNADPRYQLHGTDELRDWMQERADEIIESFNGTHFDIPEPVRTIECKIAPTTTGGIYYTPPSDDFTRPGRMWWSVPKGVTEFGTWSELSTVYHEGVPGHHLQIGQTIVQRDLLNQWRRLALWISGHGEGWALYAERLMQELGYMDDPGNRMGLLDSQSLRAARIVLDIGFHCGFEAPEEVGGGAWDYDKAWTFFNNHTNLPADQARFELNRYLGWPGQAPSYKIGERLWLELRAECQRREGADFDLKAFHQRALDVGSVGLDTLRLAVLEEL